MITCFSVGEFRGIPGEWFDVDCNSRVFDYLCRRELNCEANGTEESISTAVFVTIAIIALLAAAVAGVLMRSKERFLQRSKANITQKLSNQDALIIPSL